MQLQRVEPLPIRNDAGGQGHFGAPRGSRTHNGVDYQVKPGEPVYAPRRGIFKKTGYVYSRDTEFTIVDITDDDYTYRLMYVSPYHWLKPGMPVEEGQPVGYAQDVGTKEGRDGLYRDQGITPHVHLEVRDKTWRAIDPGVV